MLRILLILILLPSILFAIDPPENIAYSDPEWTLDSTFPKTIYDNAMEGWMMETYLGNVGVHGSWYDAPRKEVGMNLPGICVTRPTDDMSFCSLGGQTQDAVHLVQVDNSTGIARLLLGPTGLYEGDSEEVRSGWPFYNSYDDSIYLMGYGYCIRKVVDGDPITVEIVAGDCESSDTVNDTGTDARFTYINGAAADGLGNIYVITGSIMRKIDVDGEVTTITPTRSDCGTNWQVANAGKNTIHLGADPTEFYISDQVNGTCGMSILKYDTEANTLTRVIGVDRQNDTYSRYGGREKDGPAPEFTSFSSSISSGIYSPFYESYFPNGQDNLRVQRYNTNDGWLRTFGEVIRPGTTLDESITITELQGEKVSYAQNPGKRLWGNPSLITSMRSVDHYGGVYITYAGSTPAGAVLYRIYNPLLGGISR